MWGDYMKREEIYKIKIMDIRNCLQNFCEDINDLKMQMNESLLIDGKIVCEEDINSTKSNVRNVASELSTRILNNI